MEGLASTEASFGRFQVATQAKLFLYGQRPRILTRPKTPIHITTIHYISLLLLEQEAPVHVAVHHGGENLADILERTASPV
jgi:hypothetical protein